jgi:hypothetical protein
MKYNKENIMAMVKAGFTEDFIVSVSISKNEMPVTDMVEYKEAGLSEAAILKMLKGSTAESGNNSGGNKGGTGHKAPKKGTGKRSKMKWTDKPFDRDDYEAKAIEMGCFHKGKVCATVVDGEVIKTRDENKEAIYRALGYIE